MRGRRQKTRGKYIRHMGVERKEAEDKGEEYIEYNGAKKRMRIE